MAAARSLLLMALFAFIVAAHAASSPPGLITTLCPRGTVKCGNNCVNLLTDSTNCGACNQTCSRADVCHSATTSCVAGACLATTCAPDWTSCNGGKTCTSTLWDPANCGACNKTCTTANVPNSASVTCVKGDCLAATCAPGFTSCDNGRACIRTNEDRENCGACGKACDGNDFCFNSVCHAWGSCGAKGYECTISTPVSIFDSGNNGCCLGAGACQNTVPGPNGTLVGHCFCMDNCKSAGAGTCNVDSDCCSGHCITPANNPALGRQCSSRPDTDSCYF